MIQEIDVKARSYWILRTASSGATLHPEAAAELMMQPAMHQPKLVATPD